MGNLWPALLVVFSTLSALAAAQDSSSGKDIRNPLQYLPNTTVAAVGLGKSTFMYRTAHDLRDGFPFSVLMLTLFAIHSLLLVKSKAKYLLVLVIAELCEYQYQHIQRYEQLLTASNQATRSASPSGTLFVPTRTAWAYTSRSTCSLRSPPAALSPRSTCCSAALSRGSKTNNTCSSNRRK